MAIVVTLSVAPLFAACSIFGDDIDKPNGKDRGLYIYSDELRDVRFSHYPNHGQDWSLTVNSKSVVSGWMRSPEEKNGYWECNYSHPMYTYWKFKAKFTNGQVMIYDIEDETIIAEALQGMTVMVLSDVTGSLYDMNVGAYEYSDKTIGDVEFQCRNPWANYYYYSGDFWSKDSFFIKFKDWQGYGYVKYPRVANPNRIYQCIGGDWIIVTTYYTIDYDDGTSYTGKSEHVAKESEYVDIFKIQFNFDTGTIRIFDITDEEILASLKGLTSLTLTYDPYAKKVIS